MPDDPASLVGKRVRIDTTVGAFHGQRGVALAAEAREVLVRLDEFPDLDPTWFSSWAVVRDRAHPASVYRAAREGFAHVLAAVERADLRHDSHPYVLGAIAGVAEGRLRDAGGMATADLAAYVVGASAVPAVLRVRARKAQEERIGREAAR